MRERGRRATAAISAPRGERVGPPVPDTSDSMHTSPGLDSVPPSIGQSKQASRDPIGYAVAKSVLDLVLSAVGLVLLLPLFAVIALLIKLEDGGPILYKREMVGLYGTPVCELKFRTMILNAEEHLANHPELFEQFAVQMKLKHDPRVTRIGEILRRTSLDELPQLVNVLRGEMSLVGPRIIHTSEVPRFAAIAPRREQVLPGITGLWQVRGRQAVSYEERVRLDEEYLNRRSIWLDLWILVLTIPAVVSCRGAY